MKEKLIQLSLLDLLEPPTCVIVLADEVEAGKRDSICKEWRSCEHGPICMDDEINTGCFCFKDEPDKLPIETGKNADVSLSELCRRCKYAHPHCADCCAACKNTCNAGQRCTWPGAPGKALASEETAPDELPEYMFSRDQLKLLDVGSSLVRYTACVCAASAAQTAQISWLYFYGVNHGH